MTYATRYSGNLKMTINLVERAVTIYNVHFTHLGPDTTHGGDFAVCGIELSPYAQTRLASDSAEAFDEVARCAISFADEAGNDVSTADFGDDGYEIRRRRNGRVIARPGLCGVPATV